MNTTSCNAPYGSGGLGRHLAEVVEVARTKGLLERYYTTAPQQGDSAGRRVSLPMLLPLNKYTPVRFSPGWKNYLGGDIFDRAVADQLEPGQTFLGFNGQALHSFHRAQHLKYERLELLSANSHVNNVMRQHQKALHKYSFEQSWLNKTQQKKTLKEYETADLIYVASEYTRQSFLQEGIPANKLHRFVFQPSPRFQLATSRPDDDTFRVVYTGSLTVMKGIPILLEAFSRLGGKAELTLVGGSATRGMNLYLQEWLRRDSRIRIVPGDPLPHLQQADVYVHPSFEDGFAYAPMEALACKVPVIVTQDTGMKEYVQEGINGYVVPTGNWEVILEHLESLRKSPLVIR
ncbi:MAG: glycosyltransferase family 4 protein [Potamolinea sp.]